MAVSRTIGTGLIALPLLVTGRFRLTRRALPLVALAGVLEVAGGAVYVIAATADIAVAAVISSQFAAIAAIGAFIVFGERLQRIQVVGIVTIAVGVAVLSALSAS
jgi:drug/metabolite transporter (DMT)-like permease